MKIKGLIIKDLMLKKKSILLILLLSACFCGFCVLIVLSMLYGNLKELQSNNLIKGCIMAMSLILGFFSFSFASEFTSIYDEEINDDFPKLSCALPITDKDRICEKYLMAYIYTAITFVTGNITVLLMCLTAHLNALDNGIKPFLLGFGIGIFIMYFELPFLYAFGTKIKIMFPFGALMLVIIGLAILLNGEEELNIFAMIQKSFDAGAIVFALSITVGMTLSAICSYKILSSRRNVLW